MENNFKQHSNLEIKFLDCSDAKKIIDYLEIVLNETDYLSSNYSDMQINLENEIKFLEEIKNNQDILLGGFINNKLVSILSIVKPYPNKPRLFHNAELALTVLKEFWGNGIGYKMIQKSLLIASEKNLRRVELLVRTDNLRAIKLYESFRFIKEGEKKNSVCINRKFYNEYIMSILI